MHDSPIQVLELRRLLYELQDRRADICVRFRLIGEMWQLDFLRVSKLTENGVILFHAQNNQSIAVNDLREVVQFEIDTRYQTYQPHNHYSVEATINITERHVNSGR